MIRDARQDSYEQGFFDYCDLYLDPQVHAELDDWSPDAYANAEMYIQACTPADLRLTLDDIDELMALPTEQDRRRAFRYELFGIPDEPGAWDAFIAEYRARVEREQAGDQSQPLVDPRGPRQTSGPISPQGYDVSLPSAGSFSTQQVAEAVVDAVLEAYGDRLRMYLEDTPAGMTRRVPPLRMRFDRDVGVVAVRDGDPIRTRLAVVLLHDIAGQTHVYNSFPMEEGPEPPVLDALSVLFGGWLHADWVDDYPAGAWDPVEQVRRFAATEPVETVEQAAAELEVLRADGTEDDRRRAVRGFCSFFLPRPPGQLDAFLAEAAQVLAEALRGR
jgi:hypothetical protein